jgi:hypothetical protein
MKNSIKFLVVVLCLISTTVSHGQSFQKHDMFLDLGFGLGIYNTTFYNYNNDSTKRGKAGSIIIPLTFEYAIGNRIGIGVQLVTQSFLTSTDSSTNAKPSVHSGELNLFGNYHFVRSEHVDLAVGLTIGGSNFTYNTNDSNGGTLTAGGPYVDIHFGARFLFGKHLGMIASLRFPTITYIQGLASDNLGDEFNFDLKFKGTVIGTGITYKF